MALGGKDVPLRTEAEGKLVCVTPETVVVLSRYFLKCHFLFLRNIKRLADILGGKDGGAYTCAV